MSVQLFMVNILSLFGMKQGSSRKENLTSNLSSDYNEDDSEILSLCSILYKLQPF